jgi:hypothetical protein
LIEYLTKAVRLTSTSYIASLVDHLERSRDTHQPSSEKLHKLHDPAKSVNLTDDRHHLLGYSQGTYGHVAQHRSLVQQQDRQSPSLPSHAIPSSGPITIDLRRYLLQVFLDSIHRIYPILDPSLPWLSPETTVDFDPPPTQAFILQVVCGIACHCDDLHSSILVPLASAAHARALHHIEQATAEQSISTLQVAILLVLYTLFDPTSGNISQQLGFAVRLAIDLAGSDSDEQPVLLSRLYTIIYCLENHVCSVLLRPTSLPEPSSRPLTFSTEDPLEFLCTLYRLQSRIRNGNADEALCNGLSTLFDDVRERFHPNILATLCETCFMLEPSTSMAIRLISAYSDDGYIANFLTAHWVHKAGTMIINASSTADSPLRTDLMLAYGKANALLGKWSVRWDGARILLKALQSRE